MLGEGIEKFARQFLRRRVDQAGSELGQFAADRRIYRVLQNGPAILRIGQRDLRTALGKSCGSAFAVA